MYCKRRESTSTGDRLIIATLKESNSCLLIHNCIHACQTHASMASVVETQTPEGVAAFMAGLQKTPNVELRCLYYYI
jgi:hypothetical protein